MPCCTDVKGSSRVTDIGLAYVLAGKRRLAHYYLDVYRGHNRLGNAEKIAIATKKMEAAEDTRSIPRKTALATQSDFYAKEKTT